MGQKINIAQRWFGTMAVEVFYETFVQYSTAVHPLNFRAKIATSPSPGPLQAIKKMNIFFVCSRNKWRSPTAEAIYKRSQVNFVKLAGTESSARIKLTANLIAWANIIFAMEKRHKQRIIENFSFETQGKEIIVLNMPDEYQFMDEE